MSDGQDLNAKPKATRRSMSAGVCLFVVVLIVAVYVAHQDTWNWTKSEPLVFGFLPPGLAYHAGYSIVTALMMAVLVKIAWPKHLESTEEESRE